MTLNTDRLSHRLSWPGVLAGLVMGLVSTLTIIALGTVITALTGLTLTGTGIQAGIWTAIAALVGAYVAGLTAVRASAPSTRNTDGIAAMTHDDATLTGPQTPTPQRVAAVRALRELLAAGYGTEARTAALSLAFDHLGARSALTEVFPDNLASQGVSRRLGYQPDGVSWDARGDEALRSDRLRLTRERWAAGGHSGVRVEGLDACRDWFTG